MFKNIFKHNFKNHYLVFSFTQGFSVSELKLNSYLQSRLKARKFIPLKDFQIQTFNKVQQQNKNCFVNSCTGSGKTLAYLLPVLNQILKQKQAKQSATKLQQIEYDKNQRHGALIFTLNKQLAVQIYKQLRLLDVENKLRVYRLGPISHFSPVIQLLNKKQKSREIEEEIADTVDNNIIKCIDWKKTDILIGTPQMFWNIITTIAHNKNNLINPKFIVIDEADLLLELDQNVSKYMHQIIEQLKGNNNNNKNNKISSVFQKNQKDKIKYLMSSSSFPKKINKQSHQTFLEKYFKPIEIITGINKHRLPQRLQLNYIQIQSKVKQPVPGQLDHEVLKEKLYYLSKILTDPQKKTNRFIIFCSNKKSVQKVSQFVNSILNRSSIQYYASLPSDQRSLNLYKFMNEDYNILISTDLGSRGLDFTRAIHTVVQFDMSENIVNFINRAGRTARNNMPGEVITFVEEKNKVFFEHLSQLSSQDEEFDQLFSRKRSYNKMVLKYCKDDVSDQQKQQQ